MVDYLKAQESKCGKIQNYRCSAGSQSLANTRTHRLNLNRFLVISVVVVSDLGDRSVLTFFSYHF